MGKHQTDRDTTYCSHLINKFSFNAYCRVQRLQSLLERKFKETIFKNLYISLQSAIHVTIGFPISFGETNLWKSEKSTKSTKFVALNKSCPTIQIT